MNYELEQRNELYFRSEIGVSCTQAMSHIHLGVYE